MQRRNEETDLQLSNLSNELINTNNNYKLSLETMKKLALENGSNALDNVEGKMKKLSPTFLIKI